jgi:hypothetical protein
MVPSAAPAATAANSWLAHLAAHVVSAAHLHGPGRWYLAVGTVLAAWALGRISSELLAWAFRVALLAGAGLFAYQLLRI